MEKPETHQPQELSPNRTMVLIVATLGGFLVSFMSSAINIALPLIGAEFHVSAVTLSWISLSYILVAGATLLPAGRIADLYGRVRLFEWGMLIFTIISFASAFAPSAGILLVLRAVHGLGLAIGAATSTALVILAYPPESRGRALGLNIAGIYLGLTLGPVLGGLIIHNLGWRALFLVVGALGLVNLGLPLWKLRHLDWREPKKARFDVLGSVVYAVSLTAVLLGFSLLPNIPGAILIAAGIAGLAAFLWWETRAGDPILHVDLLRRNRVFAFSNAAAFINYSATAAMVFLMSLYLQYNRGLNPQMAGFVLVTGTFVQAAFSPVAGRLADRVEARYVASAGMAACALGLFALSFVGTSTPYWYIITMLCVLGLGFAFFSSPITHTIMGSIEKRWVGVASATLATMRTAGQSMSMGVATLVLALEVGRQAIQPADYPRVLSSVRVSFLIFTVLCVVGVGASLVGPRRPSDVSNR
jgi:EmrB/QacA subfamily drug resistance transporter